MVSFDALSAEEEVRGGGWGSAAFFAASSARASRDYAIEINFNSDAEDDDGDAIEIHFDDDADEDELSNEEADSEKENEKACSEVEEAGKVVDADLIHMKTLRPQLLHTTIGCIEDLTCKTLPSTRTPSTSIACACHTMPLLRSRSFTSSLTTPCPQAMVNGSERQPEFQCSRRSNLYLWGRLPKKRMHSTSSL